MAPMDRKGSRGLGGLFWPELALIRWAFCNGPRRDCSRVKNLPDARNDLNYTDGYADGAALDCDAL